MPHSTEPDSIHAIKSQMAAIKESADFTDAENTRVHLEQLYSTNERLMRLEKDQRQQHLEKLKKLEESILALSNSTAFIVEEPRIEAHLENLKRLYIQGKEMLRDMPGEKHGHRMRTFLSQSIAGC